MGQRLDGCSVTAVVRMARQVRAPFGRMYSSHHEELGLQAMLPVKALISQAMEIQFTTRILKEGRTFVAHALELDVSSCGGSKEKALRKIGRAHV